MHVEGLTPKHVLLAEDEPQVREATRLLLSALYDCSITLAANGREALDLFVPGKFDLVVTDYVMPQMDGRQLAEGIRRIDPQQPILMLTAFPEKGLSAPVNAVVAKPFPLAQLRDGVTKALSGKPLTS